jgi:hypothetical protein
VRTRITAVPILVALLAGGLAACAKPATPLAQPTPTSAPPATATPTPTATATPEPPPTTTPAPPALPRLGPNGFGALKLGMTKSQARATGLTVNVQGNTGECGGDGDGELRGTPTRSHQYIWGSLFFSHNTGRLIAIYGFPGVRTPEAVGLGSSYAKVHTAYPTWHGLGNEQEGRGGVATPGGTVGHYRIVVLEHKVIEISLDSNEQDCYE